MAMSGSASACSRPNFIGFKCMRQGTDDFEMAEFLLRRVRRSPSKLLEEHIAESRICPIDTDRVHGLFKWWYICAASLVSPPEMERGNGPRVQGWTTFFEADSLRE